MAQVKCECGKKINEARVDFIRELMTRNPQKQMLCIECQEELERNTKVHYQAQC